MKRMKKMVSLLLVICMCMCLTQYYEKAKADTTHVSGDYTYKLDDDENATITKYSGTSSSIVIPTFLDGYKVTCLDTYFVQYNTTLKEVTIQKEITKAKGAFVGSNVKKVVFENGIKSIPKEILQNCSTLEEVSIPESVTEIESSAFENCSNLKEITIPSKVSSIGEAAFRKTDISSLVLPSSIESLGGWIIQNVNNVKEVTIPRGIKSMGKAFAFSKVNKVIFEDGIEVIPNASLADCTELNEIVIPNSVTEINGSAFENCSSLKNIEIPNSVISIGEGALRKTNLNSLQLPSSIENLGGWMIQNVKNLKTITVPSSVKTMNCAFAYSSVEKVVFEDGIDSIPNESLANCTELKEVIIPNSVTRIGDSAFEKCSNITSLTVPNKVKSIETEAFYKCSNLSNIKLSNSIESLAYNCFRDCPNLIAYCNYFSNSVVACVDQDVAFSPSDERFVDSEDKFLDRSGSSFYSNVNSISTSGAFSFSIKYSIKDEWKSELKSKKIVAYIPKYTDLIDESIKIKGSNSSGYSYDSNSRRLSIPVSQDSGEISFSVSVKSKEKIKSYVYLEAKKQGTTTLETIGALNEDFSGISIQSEDRVKKDQVFVSGLSTPSTNVSLYVDGEKQDTVKTLKNGSYSGTIRINNPTNNMSYKVEAKGVDEQNNEIETSKKILYKESTPEITSLVVEWNEHNIKKKKELLDNSSVRPVISFLPNTQFVFKAKFDNRENIEEVFITSTRSNEKRILETTYDSKTDTYITSGFFDPNNTSYVPGTIHVEYNTKRDTVIATEDFDLQPYKNLVDSAEKPAVTYNKNTEKEIEATVDWSGKIKGLDKAKKSLATSSNDKDDSKSKDTLEGLDKAKIHVAARQYDQSDNISYNEIKELYDINDKTTDYIVPGKNNEKYVLNIDLSKKEKIVMVVHDYANSGFDILNKVIEFEMNCTDFQDGNYKTLFDMSDRISNISKIVDIGLETYQIHTDYKELLKEIDQSTIINDKEEARRKAAELRDDRVAFTVMCAVLPMMVAGTSMFWPSLLMSAMFAGMSQTSGLFFDWRTALIKGFPIRLDWISDPSGYVYDISNNKKIENAIVSAFYIPYDDSEDFWDNKPSKSEYGTLWDASEYEQANPLNTDDEGRYAWDVPEGWWRVKVEKEGYSTVWSDWMTVPPIQTDVNIGLTPEGWKEETTPPITEKNTKPVETKQTNSNTSKVFVPTSSSIVKIKSKKKSLKVTWKRVSGINGYKLQYSLKKNFKKAKTIVIKKATVKTKTIKKLKSNKKYFLRIRTFKVVGNKTYQSPWSKTKVKKVK